MKYSKLVLVVLVLLAVVSVSPAKSFATAATCICSVNYAGPVTESGNKSVYEIAISLTYVSGLSTAPSTTTKTFYAPKGHENQFLAVALAAIANGKNVSAMVDFSTATSTTVYNLFLEP